MSVVEFPSPALPPEFQFPFPTLHQRAVVMGRTGTGKTQFGFWLLSEAPFNRQPYVIVDYKRDTLLNATDRIKEIGLGEHPKHPGLYIVHPMPEDEERVEAWLWKAWKKTKIGLYFDEAYMLPQDGKSPALRSILTQGRSLRIPVIALTQRPAWVSRFIFSEADFYSYFHFNDSEDVKTARRWFPPGAVEQRLPKYHSVWTDGDPEATYLLQPVPDADTLLDRIEDRLSVRRRAL